MPVAGIQEALRTLDHLRDLAGGDDIPLADEDRVLVHAMDLDRYAVRPGSEGPFAADREAGVEEQGAATLDRVCASFCAGSTPKENPA